MTNHKTTKQNPQKIEYTALQVASMAARAADDKQAGNPLVLDIQLVSNLADYFVICSGESSAQIKAIGDAISETLSNSGLELIGKEGDQTSRWTLLDYGDVVVHIMHSREREFYQLESFWNHATVVPQSRWDFPQVFSKAS